MQMQIRALRDLYLQRDRLVQKLERGRHVTNHYINVCFIRYIINKSQRFFYISFYFMFFEYYITISYCID